jgi:hypothetical protein
VTPTREAPDYAYLQRELRHKGVTLQLLWDEYRTSDPAGYGYSQFCKLYRDWRGRIDVVMRQDHLAGEKLFVDFPGLTIPIHDEVTLEVLYRAELFVAVLGASNYLFCEALRSQALEHWVNANAHCFEFLGGCPAILVLEYVPRNIFELMCPVALCGAFGVEPRNCGGGRTGDGDRGHITLVFGKGDFFIPIREKGSCHVRGILHEASDGRSLSRVVDWRRDRNVRRLAR